MYWVWMLVLIWCAWSCWRLGSTVEKLTQELRDVRYQGNRNKSQADEDRAQFQVLRAHTAALADGKKVARDQVLKGQFYSEITAIDAYAKMQGAAAPKLIDVRSAQEFLIDHAVGAELLPLDELPNRLAELPSKETPLLLICASGGRSLQAAEYLASQGWSDVASVKGGTGAWPGPHERRNMMSLKYTPPQKAG